MKEKKKKIIISTCLIFVLILAVVGISYAAFQFVGQGQQVNQITTGTIQMNYEEGTNVIRLTNALPTTDATGKVRLTEGEYFDFSVTTNITGDALINWEIAAEDFSDNTFDGSNVKFYLTKLVDGNEEEVSSSLPAVYNEKTSENKKTGRPSNMMSLLTGSTSTQGEEITNYRLRLYVDENYNPQGDGGGLIFKTRINAYGKVSTEPPTPVLDQNWYSTLSAHTVFEQNNFYTNKLLVTNHIDIPSTALLSVDVSEDQNGSVIAYVDTNGKATVYDYDLGENKEVDAYQIVIGAKNSDVYAPVNSSRLFYSVEHTQILDLEYLNTSNTTDMSNMFGSEVTSINMDNFNTSNVTNMSGMFDACMLLDTYNLRSFDMTNVVNRTNMFPYHRIIDFNMYVDISWFDKIIEDGNYFPGSFGEYSSTNVHIYGACDPDRIYTNNGYNYIFEDDEANICQSES